MRIHFIRPAFSHRKRGKEPVSLIVLHATAGSTLKGAIDTLRDRGLGYHYLIDKDGSVWKGCPSTMRTGHAGNSYGPLEEISGLLTTQNSAGEFIEDCSVNSYSIGISFVNENDGRHAYTDAQERSVRELIAELRRAFPDLKHLTSHAIVSPRRKSDPLGYDLDRLGKDVDLSVWRPAGQKSP